MILDKLQVADLKDIIEIGIFRFWRLEETDEKSISKSSRGALEELALPNHSLEVLSSNQIRLAKSNAS